MHTYGESLKSTSHIHDLPINSINAQEVNCSGQSQKYKVKADIFERYHLIMIEQYNV